MGEPRSENLGQLVEDDEAPDFSHRVLRLVEAAVQQRDVEALQAEWADNARRAREELERQSAEIERVLGAIDAPQAAAMPKIARTRPSLELRAFWQDAMRASGWTLAPRDGGATLEASRRGHVHRRFTFDPGHRARQGQILGAYAVELVAEDERALDEMVRAWTLSGIDATTVRPPAPAADAGPLLAALLAPRVTRIRAIRAGGVSHQGSLEVIARVNTSVFRDQYEKILSAGSARNPIKPCRRPALLLFGGRGATPLPRTARDTRAPPPSPFDERRAPPAPM